MFIGLKKSTTLETCQDATCHHDYFDVSSYSVVTGLYWDIESIYFNYENWMTSGVEGTNAGDCFKMDRNYKISSTGCTDNHHMLCQFDCIDGAIV